MPHLGGVRVIRPVLLVLSAAVAAARFIRRRPPDPTPSTLNISGVWDVVTTLSSGTGNGPCFGLFFIGQQSTSVANIQHNGTNVTATVSDASGFQYSYTGTLNGSQFFVSLTASNLAFTRTQCTNGLGYDLRLATHTLTGTATSSVITGTGAQTTNVFQIPVPPIVQTGQFLDSSMSLQSTIRLTKR